MNDNPTKRPKIPPRDHIYSVMMARSDELTRKAERRLADNTGEPNYRETSQVDNDNATREWAEKAYDFLERLDDALTALPPGGPLMVSKIVAELRALMGEFPCVE